MDVFSEEFLRICALYEKKYGNTERSLLVCCCWNVDRSISTDEEDLDDVAFVDLMHQKRLDQIELERPMNEFQKQISRLLSLSAFSKSEALVHPWGAWIRGLSTDFPDVSFRDIHGFAKTFGTKCLTEEVFLEKVRNKLSARKAIQEIKKDCKLIGQSPNMSVKELHDLLQKNLSKLIDVHPELSTAGKLTNACRS
jgi:hypothetical protein